MMKRRTLLKTGHSDDSRHREGSQKGSKDFFVDSYYTLLVVRLRRQEISWTSGLRPATVSS